MKFSFLILIFAFSCSTNDEPTVQPDAKDIRNLVDTSHAATSDMGSDLAIDVGPELDFATRDTGGFQDTAVTDLSSAEDMVASDVMAGDVGEDMPNVVEPPDSTIALNSTYFHTDANAPIGVRAWATAAYPSAMPENARSTIFWGRFANQGCENPGYGDLVEYPFTSPGRAVFHAFYPDCLSNYGPSVDAKVYAFGASQHLLRSEMKPNGAFQSFGALGQNASGANKHIMAAYTEFNPSWQTPNRMFPWGGPSTDPSQLRVAIRVKESVTKDILESPSSQQLQQVIRFLVINEGCDPNQSSSFCQIELNFKTFNRGVGAYTSFDSGDVFSDGGQGGLIAVVGPIASSGNSTTISGSPAWTSWGSSTQLQSFEDKTFQVEISWTQFQTLLMNVSNNNPAGIFGARWNDPQAWVLLRIGYGQENYNRSPNTSSSIEGLFESVEIFAL